MKKDDGLKYFDGWNFIQPTQKNSILPFGMSVDGIFQPDELKKIDEYCANLKLRDGTIGSEVVDPTIRKSRICFFDVDGENHWWTSRLNHCLSTVNDEVFRFDLTGFIGLQYTEYQADSSHYDWHIDTKLGADEEEIKQGKITPHMRKLSMTFILSDSSEYSGGEFEIDHGVVFSPPQRRGDAIFFPSFLKHRVKPVTEGIRRSIVIWAVGPKFK